MKDIITNYIKAGYAGLYLVTAEESRAQAEIKSVAKSLKFKLFHWSITQGLIDIEGGNKLVEPGDPVEMLNKIAALPDKCIVVAHDFHLFLSEPNPIILRTIRDMLNDAKSRNKVFLVLGCQIKMQPEIEKEMTLIEYKLPDRETLKWVIDNLAESTGMKNFDREKVIDAATGLTTLEAENVISLSIVETKTIAPHIIAREKASVVKKNGLLELIMPKETSASIGGLENLKSWLSRRKSSFSKEARDYGLPTPKGVLTVGPPGTGKSISARVSASVFGVPLLKLDMGKVFGSLVGESERNLRTIIQTAEAIAPCVLWADEIEKGLAGSQSSGQTDGGTSARVFGSFLQWMNDKTAPVFVFATANDISALPPEFLRKGRFDELFFVDLPTEAERKEIWDIQLRKYGRKPEDFDLEKLSGNSADFTGAEIEGALTEALFAAFDDKKEVSMPYLVSAIATTIPLAKTMSTQIAELRKWADGRARKAGKSDSAAKSLTRKIINN